MMDMLKSAIRATAKKNEWLVNPALSVAGLGSSRLEVRARQALRLFPPVVSVDMSPLGDRLEKPIQLYIAGGRDQSATALFRGGWSAYEHPLPALICAGLMEAGPGAWVDIGANTGIYSLMTKAVQPDRRSYAFEPSPQVLELLERNIALNAASGDIEVVKVAASDCRGTAQLFIPSQDHGLIETSASLSSTFRPQHSEVVDIDTIPLDEFAPLADQRVAVMKIDVEGAEDRVLHGALRTLQRSKTLVFCEILSTSGTWDAVIKLLDQIDYDIASIEPTQIRVGVTAPGHSILEGEVDNFILFPRGSDIVAAVAAKAHLQLVS